MNKDLGASATQTGLSSLRDRAAARLVALRFNPSRWLGRRICRHSWQILHIMDVPEAFALVYGNAEVRCDKCEEVAIRYVSSR